MRKSWSQHAIAVLLTLNLGYCVFAWPPAMLCNGPAAWSEWFVVIESLLLIGIVPLLAISIGVRSLQTVAIAGGVLTLIGIGVTLAFSATGILECS